MCMGLGCNAVGVMGCRIIQSPRERLIAILTNALVPCNGRFPTLIALISMFFVLVEGPVGSLAGAAMMLGLIVLCVGVTLGCSRLLSATVLKGVPSAFALELPPFRRPKVGQVLIRSVLDRTLFVLGRAVTVAAPARPGDLAFGEPASGRYAAIAPAGGHAGACRTLFGDGGVNSAGFHLRLSRQ